MKALATFVVLLAGLATPALANCPVTYSGVDVGAPALAGHTTELVAGSAYDVSAAGADIYAKSDQFHFAFQAHSGDFDLRVRVASLTAVNEWSKAGLMARESMVAGSREVSVLATPARGYEFQYRANTGAFVQKVDSAARVSYPNTWVRLRRAGNEFRSYTSADGVSWTLLGSATLALPGTIFLGMAVTSHDVKQAVTAQFRDLGPTATLPDAPLPPPPAAADTSAPSTPAGLTAIAVSASRIDLAWSASTDNVAVTSYQVLRDGILVGGSSTRSYADTGLSPASRYTYTVAAVDGAGNASAPSAPVSATTPEAAAGSARAPLGTNLSGIQDWSREWTFVDAFRASRAWISGGGLSGAFDDGRAIATDANGWVTSLQSGQVARSLLFWDLGGHYPAGTYIVLYDGQGSLAYQGAATKVSGTPGRDVLQVNPANGGIILNITATTAGDPLRNIRMLMPGGICEGEPFRHAADASACADAAAFRSFEAHYASIVFHPKFLERIRSYGALRFMDWGATNDSTQSAWSGRPKPSDARWTEKGVPVEVMVDLANRVGADAWFTLPHQADDTYVTEYAKLVKQGLRSDLKAYVEYSNEVWNGQFAQAGYASSRGLALGLSANSFEAQMYFYSRRSVEIFDIWSAVFADPARLVRVMASQAANSWISEQLLDYQNARLKTDALAAAPYFGGSLGDSSATATMTLDQLFSALQSSALPEAIGWINAQAAVARARGLPLIAYEGGQHLAGVRGFENDAALNALFDAANRDPRMAALYLSYLDAWKASGAQLFVHYTSCDAYSKWGRWGALEFLEQPRAQAPKFDALQSFIEANPVWW